MPLLLPSNRGEQELLAIKDLRHPHYVLNQENWEKWRLCYLGGSRFIKRYLKKFSRREDDADFRERAEISYAPAFAKMAINEVKNSIFQRCADVTRAGGPQTYRDAIIGRSGGVDLNGSIMNIYLGRDILPELLVMGRVGIYVDMPTMGFNTTIAEKGSKHPYLYWYKAEDIRAWSYFDSIEGSAKEFKALLLRDNVFDINPHWNLPYQLLIRYRYVWIGEDGFVKVKFFNEDATVHYPPDIATDENGTIHLDLRRIPFTLLEISDSLMTDVADYQIALLNLASADMAFATKANFPFYTEQFDVRSASPYMRQVSPNQMPTTQTVIDPQSASMIVQAETSREIKVGVSQGRRYPIGVERPAFINPSPEPMMASMEKQKVLKEEIRQLVLQTVSSLVPQRSDIKDEGLGLEAGLSYIGQELQHAEHRIATFWDMYEGTGQIATIQYPENYALIAPQDRLVNANKLVEIMPKIPSLTFQKEVAKKAAEELLVQDIPIDTLQKIYSEIDSMPVVQSDPDVIKTDVENGLVSLETASKARGYPPGEVDKAKQDHSDRLMRILEAQSTTNAVGGDPASRGVPDASDNPSAPDEEKHISQKDQTLRGQVKDRTRGKGQNNETQ